MRYGVAKLSAKRVGAKEPRFETDMHATSSVFRRVHDWLNEASAQLPPEKIGPCAPGPNDENASPDGAAAAGARDPDCDAGSRNVSALSAVIGTLGFASSSVLRIE